MLKVLGLATEFFQLMIKSSALIPNGNSKADKLFNCIKSIESGSSKISAWSLSIFGGSLLAILSDSYIHPTTTNLKMIYLIFILGWIFIGVSIFNGKEISGSAIASELHKDDLDQLAAIFKKCNSCYAKQLRFFNLALLVFGIWILLYLFWWIFNESTMIDLIDL